MAEPFNHFCLTQNFSALNITGSDSSRFLQGQLTVNLENIQPKELKLAGLCNPAGRLISLFFIHPIADGFRLIMHQDLIDITQQHLQKYAVFYKVKLAAADKDEHLVTGPPDTDLLVARMELTSHFSVALVKPAELETIKTKHLANTAQTLQADSQLWLKYLLFSGIPWLSAASSGALLPHSINLPQLGAVDFKKGCFTGQEIIARMQYKGKLKTRLVFFQCDQQQSTAPLDKIFLHDKSVGEVVCAIQENETSISGLAVLKLTALESPQEIRLGGELGPILSLK